MLSYIVVVATSAWVVKKIKIWVHNAASLIILSVFCTQFIKKQTMRCTAIVLKIFCKLSSIDWKHTLQFTIVNLLAILPF